MSEKPFIICKICGESFETLQEQFEKHQPEMCVERLKKKLADSYSLIKQLQKENKRRVK